jgi:hypothetical protein
VSLVVLDTDVASALLRRRASAAQLRILDGSIPAVTFVTIGELTKWTLVRHWGPIRRDHVRTFLDAMVTLPYDSRARSGIVYLSWSDAGLSCAGYSRRQVRGALQLTCSRIRASRPAPVRPRKHHHALRCFPSRRVTWPCYLVL